MHGWRAAAALALAATAATAQQQVEADVAVKLAGTTVYGALASFGAVPSGLTYAAIAAPTDAYSFGCSAADFPVISPSVRTLAVIARGNCSFVQKAVAAQSAGADAVAIYDSIAGQYGPATLAAGGNASSLMAGSSCDYQCSYGAGVIPAGDVTPAAALSGYPGQCASVSPTGGGGACASNLCLLTPQAPDAAGGRQVCCLVSDLLVMGAGSTAATAAGASQLTIPAVMLTTSDGLVVLQAAGLAPVGGGGVSTNATATVVMRADADASAGGGFSSWEPAPFVLWCLGLGTALLAAWYSATEERVRLKAFWRGDDEAAALQAQSPHIADAAGQRVHITPRQGVGMLFMAGVVLVGLYFLIRYVNIVLIVIAIFFIGAISAGTSVGTSVVHYVAPKLSSIMVVDTPRFGGVRVSAAGAVALIITAAVASVWLVFRKSSWAWVLNDALGVALCCTFLLQLRLSRLRDAALILGLFFAYDIFMVFLSPYIVGTSIMVDVATAGQPVAPSDATDSGGDWACYCRQHPGDSTSCGPGETMPILLRIPRMRSPGGSGYAMLGLGDIVVPGLLLSFALRTDYALMRGMRAAAETTGAVAAAAPVAAATSAAAAAAAAGANAAVRAPWKAGYFHVAALGYGFGLALAYAAVQLMQMGQPALLYLCPLVFLPVAAMARSRGQWDYLWYGLGTTTIDTGSGGARESLTGATAAAGGGGGGGGGASNGVLFASGGGGSAGGRGDIEMTQRLHGGAAAAGGDASDDLTVTLADVALDGGAGGGSGATAGSGAPRPTSASEARAMGYTVAVRTASGSARPPVASPPVEGGGGGGGTPIGAADAAPGTTAAAPSAAGGSV